MLSTLVARAARRLGRVWPSMLTALATLTALSCASAPRETTSDTPEFNWVAMETGRHCARGQVACGLGNCAANVANRCREPVTCELTVQCVCQAFTGESGEALGRAKETIGPGEKVGVLARVICGDGEVLATHAKRLRCR